MHKAIWLVGALLVAGSGSALAQAAAPEIAILAKTEQWTFWMMVTGAASAVFAACSVAGLLWTFREQRKLTHAQERAIVGIVKGTALADTLLDSQTYELKLHLRNTGRTHAFSVTGVAAIYSGAQMQRMFVGANDEPHEASAVRRAFKHEKPVQRRHFGMLEELAPDESAPIRLYFTDLPDFARQEIHHSSGVGIYLHCVVVYRDAYGKRHTIEVSGDYGLGIEIAQIDLDITRSSNLGPDALKYAKDTRK